MLTKLISESLSSNLDAIFLLRSWLQWRSVCVQYALRGLNSSGAASAAAAVAAGWEHDDDDVTTSELALPVFGGLLCLFACPDQIN